MFLHFGRDSVTTKATEFLLLKCENLSVCLRQYTLHWNKFYFQRSHVFQRACGGHGRWTKLEDGLRLELPKDTLIEAEVVTELRGEVIVSLVPD